MKYWPSRSNSKIQTICVLFYLWREREGKVVTFITLHEMENQPRVTIPRGCVCGIAQEAVHGSITRISFRFLMRLFVTMCALKARVPHKLHLANHSLVDDNLHLSMHPDLACDLILLFFRIRIAVTRRIIFHVRKAISLKCTNQSNIVAGNSSG